MFRITLLILMFLVLSPTVSAKSPTFGPFDLNYRVFKVNGAKVNITRSAKVYAQSSISNARFAITERPGRLTLPPGTYRISGHRDDCKIDPQLIDIYSNRKLILKAICK